MATPDHVNEFYIIKNEKTTGQKGENSGLNFNKKNTFKLMS